MGSAMARRLVDRGQIARGWNRSAISAADQTRLGIQVVKEIADLVATSDILILSQFDDRAVQDVLNTLCAFDPSGKLIVDTSTVSPKCAGRRAGGHSGGGRHGY